MPDRVIMVRESEWREMREALRDLLELVQDQPNETDLAFGITEIEPYLKVDGSTLGVIARARAALAKSEAAATQPVAYAYVVAGECEQIEWGTDVDLPDDPALVWLYPHPTPDGCGRAGKPRVKKLEWRQHGPQGIAADFEAFTYAIYQRAAGLCDLFFGHTDEETLALGVSEQEAKGTAQADFERRILSALEAPPPEECPTCGFPDDEMVAEYHAGEVADG